MFCQWMSSCSSYLSNAAVCVDGRGGGIQHTQEHLSFCTKMLLSFLWISYPKILCCKNSWYECLWYQSAAGEAFGLQWLLPFIFASGPLWENLQASLSVHDECWPGQGRVCPLARHKPQWRTLQDKERWLEQWFCSLFVWLHWYHSICELQIRRGVSKKSVHAIMQINVLLNAAAHLK